MGYAYDAASNTYYIDPAGGGIPTLPPGAQISAGPGAGTMANAWQGTKNFASGATNAIGNAISTAAAKAFPSLGTDYTDVVANGPSSQLFSLPDALKYAGSQDAISKEASIAGTDTGDAWSFAKNLVGGAVTGSTGTSLLGDMVGGAGQMLGNKLVKGITGGGSSASTTSTNAAKEAADAMIQETANAKSSLLQNTNALGSQGAKAGLEAQQAMNSQALSGDAIQSMNTLRNNAAKLQSNQMSLANNQMRQNQMQTAGLKDAIRSQAGSSPTAKLGNIGAIGSELAKNNAATYGQTAQALAGAGQQAAQMNAQASDVRNQDLASNFERNVKPTLNNWENFQSMASNLGSQAVQAGTSAASSADSASYNLFGGTAKMLGQRAGQQEGLSGFLKGAGSVKSVTGLLSGIPF